MEINRVGSVRLDNSVWSGENELFSSSTRKDEDDEEALKWASLERLPTYSRARMGILSLPAGKLKEVDVQKLNFEERNVLLERLMHMAEEDHERFLIKLKERIDRVGIELPTIEVRYEHLSIEARTYVGERALPTMFNFFVNILEGIANLFHLLPSKKLPLTILHDVSGIIRPRRLTLLLGPPGSGKSTLLLALTGKLSSDLKVIGRVTYNGHGMDEFVPQKTAAYISQYDLHLGELTVRETLAFSASCQGVGSRYEMISELLRREKAAKIKPDPDVDVFMKAMASSGQKENIVTDYILKILGLDICADTIVGDGMRRGISGGQRKRVTTGEMLVGPARALFMDEISTGLDSSTTFQIVKTLRQIIYIHAGTAVISLLQPAPETYNLFDDIILLSDCQIVYQGPRENVLEFFEYMGFKCPERKDVADFLQEVTSRKDQEQYWACHDKPYKYIPASEFAKAFHSFHVGQSLRKDISVPYDKSKNHPAALATSRYGASSKQLLKATMARELLLVKRNSIIYIFKLAQTMIMSIVLMTVFFRTKMHHNSLDDGGIYLGALYFGIGSFMFNGFAELPMTIQKLPYFYKQRDYLFFPAWVYALPTSIIRVPLTFIDVAVWVFTTYYAVGFDPNVSRLFKQYLLFLMLNQMASALFRFLGAIGRDMVVGTTVASTGLTVLLVLGGFILSRDNINKWWVWGYWISPLMYAQNAIAANEFLGHSWSKVLPGTTEKLGVALLKSRSIFTDAKWYWIGIGAMAGYTILANVFFMLALTYLNPLATSQPAISNEALKERRMNLSGEVAEKSSSKEDSDGRKKNDDVDGMIVSNPDPNQRKGMCLPFVPLSVAFENITYSVEMPQEMRAHGVKEKRLELLKEISGSFRPGVLTALMGVSGAGKTTLMDVLAGRKTGGHIEGTITVSGFPKKQETFARVSAYCEQNDIHSPHITVYESLVFSAWLRLPSNINDATRRMFIKEVMDLIELQTLRDAIVGMPGVNGLSTEQRKRLTIAVELVANPSIIFMDEPTSGLDARAAAIVMRTVRNIVDTGRTIVCTIHQPSIDIFESFDELFLMKRGGEEIYVGPLGHRSIHLINYFEGINGVRKIENGHNPATWMLEVTTSAQEDILGVNFSRIYKNSELYQRNKELIKHLSIPDAGSNDLHFPTKYSKPFLVQCMACLWKQHWSYWRNTSYTAIRFLFTFAVGLLFGSIFWDLGMKRSRQLDLFNSMGSMYSAVLFLGGTSSSTVQPVVAVERTVFYREKAAGTYSPLAFALAQVVIEIPYVLIQSLIYGIVVYTMMGFEYTSTKFFWYIYFMFMTLLTYTFYGVMAVGLTPNISLSSILSGAFYSIWNLFSGFLIPQTRLPIWLRWYVWICPPSWTLYGLVASQYGDIHDKLDNGVSVADFLMNYFGFKHSFLGVVAVAVVAFPICFAFVFLLSLKMFNFQRR